MEEQISIIKQDYLRRRIQREVDFLVSENICNKEETSISQYEKNFIFQFKNLKDKKNYEFIVSQSYPFKPPKLLINNKLIDFDHHCSDEMRILLKKYTGIECFCCESILCCNNWSPILTFKHIIDDINRFRKAISKINICIILDIIKRKYLNKDINIIEWLF